MGILIGSIRLRIVGAGVDLMYMEKPKAIVQQALNVNKEAAGLAIKVWIFSSPRAKLTLRLGVPNLLQKWECD